MSILDGIYKVQDKRRDAVYNELNQVNPFKPDRIDRDEYNEIVALVGHEYAKMLVHLRFSYIDDARERIAKFLSYRAPND